MNPLTNVKNIQKLNERELELGVIGKKSWHDEYKDSAWIFIGGLPYDLSEGDIICVFSQYGEVVNMNLVRDHKTGKSKGFAFLCYEDQRSTVLAVDNLNSIKILSRVIRVDHVKDYKVPKDHKEDDELILKMRNEGCAPKIKPDDEAPEGMDVKEEEKPTKKRKKEKKAKKKNKKNEKKRKSSSSSSGGTSGDENGSSDSDSNARLAKVKKEIKQEVYDRGYDRAAEPSASSGNGFNARGKQTWSRDRADRVDPKEERKTTSDYREKEKHRERSESGWGGRSAREREDLSRKDGRSQENVDDWGGREYDRCRYDERGREGDRNKNRDRFQDRKQDLVRESDRFREADRFRDYDRDRHRGHGKDTERERYRDNSRDSSGNHDRYREEKRRRDRSRER